MDQIAVYLTTEEAQQFIEFQKYYDKFSTLKQAGVLDMHSESLMIHIDNAGTIRKIEKLEKPRAVVLFFQA